MLDNIQRFSRLSTELFKANDLENESSVWWASLDMWKISLKIEMENKVQDKFCVYLLSLRWISREYEGM